MNAKTLMMISVLLAGCNAQEPVAPVDETDPFSFDAHSSGGLKLAEDSPIEVIERREGALHCWLVTFEGGGWFELISPETGGLLEGTPIQFPATYQDSYSEICVNPPDGNFNCFWRTVDASMTPYVANNPSGDGVAIWTGSNSVSVFFLEPMSLIRGYYATDWKLDLWHGTDFGQTLFLHYPGNLQSDGFTRWDQFEYDVDENVITRLRMDGIANATLIDDFEACRIEFITIEIDIKPGSDPNCFNNDGHGVIPVAILGSSDFDVTQIDPATVQLEGLAVRAVGKADKLQAHIEDVNGDGFDDLVVQIDDTDRVFTSGLGTATLTGQLLDGTPIQGSDSICIVP